MTRYRHIVVAALAAGVLVACAGVPPDDPYAIRVRRLEQKVDSLSHQPTGQNLASLADRTDNIESQLRKLRGQLQELSHELDQTTQRQRDLYQDVDQRLRTLELRAGVQKSGPSGGSSGGPAPGSPSSFAQPATMSNNAGQVAPTENTGAGSAAPRQASASGRQAYQHAFDLLKQGRYQDAASAFRDFLNKHPDSPLADNGQYWLGEVNYVDRDFKVALNEFQKVLDNYPNSAKAPDALLKVGYCNYELKQYADARQALNKVVSQYSGSTAARLASQRLKRMNNNNESG